MTPNLAVAAALTLLLASGLLPGPYGTSPPAQPPTPEHWDEWQPQTDPSDTRLDSAFVSVWEPDITVADLLTRLSEQSSVQLSAADGLLTARLTIFAEDRMLSGVMVALAALCHGRWVFERGQPPTRRAYRLIGSASPMPALDRLIDDFFLYLTGTSLDERRQRFPDRLALYRAALSLSPDEILRRYEQDDPWLCADLLDPDTRAVAETLCQLDQDAIHDLLYRGLTHVGFGDLSPSYGQQLRDTAEGRWSAPEATAGNPDTRHPPAAQDPLDHTPVNLRWNGSDVQLYLGTPDRHTSPLGRLSLDDHYIPGEPRRRLIELGYRADTPEYQSTIQAESRAWEAAWEEKAEPLGLLGLDEYLGSFNDLLLDPPNQTDPRLDIPLDLSLLDPDSLAPAALLEQAARQCRIAVIADQPPLDDFTLSSNQLSDPPTLRSILNEIRSVQGDGFSWNFYGYYLVAIDDECAAERLLYPADPLEWMEEQHPIASNAMEDLAAFIAAAVSIH